jgi:hypothetical protein
MSTIEDTAVKHDDDLTVFLSCECNSPDHTIIIQVFDWGDNLPYKPDFIVNVQASNYQPFFKRVKAALKYIFGSELIWNDVIIDSKDIPKLQAAIDHYNSLLDKK